MKVRLSWYEAAEAARAGTQRNIQALSKARRAIYGKPSSDWDVHIEGCAAERAVAKAYNLYWEPVVENPEELRGDVGLGMRSLQVRSTWRRDGRLITHDRDNDEHVFVLVVGRLPDFEIKGWILGADAKQKCFWRSDLERPAFFVPQDKLNGGIPPQVQR